jgi:protein required for attachment to host cells
MAKIVDEAKILRYDEIGGKRIPVYSAKVETTVTNIKTGQEYSSHEECQADIDNSETDTTEADIRRDVHVTAPNVFAGAHTLPE